MGLECQNQRTDVGETIFSKNSTQSKKASTPKAAALNRIVISHEQRCGGICSSKDTEMEGLSLNRTATSCCETSHTAVPFASIDDIQLIIPTKLQSCMKLILCGSVRRNGKWEYCECSCNDTIINVQYAAANRIYRGYGGPKGDIRGNEAAIASRKRRTFGADDVITK